MDALLQARCARLERRLAALLERIDVLELAASVEPQAELGSDLARSDDRGVDAARTRGRRWAEVVTQQSRARDRLRIERALATLRGFASTPGAVDVQAVPMPSQTVPESAIPELAARLDAAQAAYELGHHADNACVYLDRIRNRLHPGSSTGPRVLDAMQEDAGRAQRWIERIRVQLDFESSELADRLRGWAEAFVEAAVDDWVEPAGRLSALIQDTHALLTELSRTSMKHAQALQAPAASTGC